MGITAPVLALIIAFAAGLVAAAMYWRQRSSLIAVDRHGVAQAAASIVYNDAPTVRVVDSQRVDRLRKLVQIKRGTHVDILETQAGASPRFRITLKSIEEAADAPAAHIAVDFRGAALSCGPLVQEVAYNEFIVPRAQRDEPRSSVFHYRERDDALDFMRIRVRSIDAQAGTADLDVMQVQGHWPTH